MTLILTITNERLEAALYQTGPRLVLKEHHTLLEAVAKLEAKAKKITGIVAVIGPVSFTRHRQTIALVNAYAALKSIPSAAIEFTEHVPDETLIAKTVAALTAKKPGIPLVPHYRAEPTITLKK